MQPPAEQPDRKKPKILYLIGGGLALLAVALLLADSYFREDPVQQEMRQLQGTWRLARAEIDGQPADISWFPKHYQVQGNRVIIGDTGYSEKGFQFRVDPNQNPKAIDFIIREDEQEGVSLGIYELQGNTLKLSMSGGTRPTELRGTSLLDTQTAY